MGCTILVVLTVAQGHAEPRELTGMIEPSEIVDISSQVPGILEEITVERGDRVRVGQVLARLKSGVEKAAVDLAKARVEFGRRKAVRNEELYQKQLMSIHEKDELETEIKIAELQLQEALEKLDLRIIRSSTEGVVLKRSRAPGEYIGEDAILTVARIHPLHVEVVAPLTMYGFIKKGTHAQVRPEPPIGGVYDAVVSIVDPVVDAASGNFGVRLELSNPEYRIPAGVRCQVRFTRK
jgi:RND family efflux transporter MFP subunit